MKDIRKYISRWKLSLLLVPVMVLSCTSDFDSINTNKSVIGSIGASEIPFLFSKAQSSATNSQWNYQVAQNLFADQYSQYFACAATYFPSDRNVIRMDWVGAAFNPMYTDVLPQLQTIFENTEESSAEYAMANVMWVFTFHRVTDYWGPIPYFQAGQDLPSVPYDPQDQIYDDFFKRLDAAVTALESHTDSQPYGSYDLFYHGDVSKWIKFANSLRLRLALRISNVDPTRAKTEAEAAVAGGVFESSPDDDALVDRSVKGSDGNGLSIMSDWNEFRMSASMESVLKGYDDPRMGEYFLPAKNTGTYEGMRNGLTSTQLGEDLNKADANSHVGKRWSSPSVTDKDGNVIGSSGYLETRQNIMSSAEVYFLLAEGAMKGWNMGGTAKEFYEAGIRNSMYQWGITDETAISNYIQSTATPVAPGDFLNSPPMTDIPVKYDEGDTDVAMEQIATQKWLAMFPDGMEAWADFRRTRLVKLYPVANSDNADIPDPSAEVIRRIPFLDSEKLTNTQAVDDAVNLLGGPDKVTTPLWWDTN